MVICNVLTTGTIWSNYCTTQNTRAKHTQPWTEPNWQNLFTKSPHPSSPIGLFCIWRRDSQQSSCSLDWSTISSIGMVHHTGVNTTTSKKVKVQWSLHHPQVQQDTPRAIVLTPTTRVHQKFDKASQAQQTYGEAATRIWGHWQTQLWSQKAGRTKKQKMHSRKSTVVSTHNKVHCMNTVLERNKQMDKGGPHWSKIPTASG